VKAGKRGPRQRNQECGDCGETCDEHSGLVVRCKSGFPMETVTVLVPEGGLRCLSELSSVQ